MSGEGDGGGDDESLEPDDREHLATAITIISEEKSETRALIKTGDLRVNRITVRLGLSAALLAIATTLGPFFLPAFIVASLGVLGGALGGVAVFFQFRWNARRSELDGVVTDQEDALLNLATAEAELKGRDAVRQKLLEGDDPKKPEK